MSNSSPSIDTRPPGANKPGLALGPPTLIQAYVYGLRQPCAVLRLRVARPEALGEALAALAPEIESATPEMPSDLRPALPADAPGGIGALADLTVLLARLQEAANIAVLEPARLHWQPPGKEGLTVQIALPSSSPAGAASVLAWAGARLAGDSARGMDAAALVKALAPYSAGAPHRLVMMRAAHRREIPLIGHDLGVGQFGWGCKGRLMQNSISDATPAIGTRLAASKPATSALLRAAGYPVPEERIVADAEAAVAAAEAIGYPVVVKPTDLARGTGVKTRLSSPDAVRAAYAAASEHSANIMVQRMIPGDLHRVQIIGGEYAGTFKRGIAAVTGDGSSSIEQLVTEANRDPRRGPHDFSEMRPIVLDDEALTILQGEGLTPAAVPEAGRHVFLRNVPSNYTGGYAQVLEDDRLHPDNIALCRDVTAMLRLDIAGIDLIIPDITRSWQEVGGGICEVNASPQMGLTIKDSYEKIFAYLMPDAGRIPVVMILAEGAEAEALRRALLARDIPGLAVAEAGALTTSQGRRSPGGGITGAVKAGLVDIRTGALAILTDGAEFQQKGLPVDRFDLLALAMPSAGEALAPRLSVLAPHLTGPLCLAGPEAQAALARRFLSGRVETCDADALAGRIASVLKPGA